MVNVTGWEKAVRVIHATTCGRWPHDSSEACAPRNEAERLVDALYREGLYVADAVEGRDIE